MPTTTALATNGVFIPCMIWRMVKAILSSILPIPICTLEFVPHRELYDWLIEKLGIYPSHQYEFARRNMNYTVTSKRKLLQLVNEKYCNRLGRSPYANDLGFTPQRVIPRKHS